MSKTTRISKWGSSLAVRIPKAIAEEWGVKEGTQIELTRDSNGVNLRKTQVRSGRDDRVYAKRRPTPRSGLGTAPR